MILTAQQQDALRSVQAFLDIDEHIFILKGYAGTGKTTLIRHLTQLLENRGQVCSVMAPTGRAARILREKIGENNKNNYGQTIHRSIYNFDNVYIKETPDLPGLKYFYHFPVRVLDLSGHVCIVDEASMVSSFENNHEILKFGTGRLLDDLLTFTRIPSAANKIIFVGDPAQLPPVGESVSRALDSRYFNELNIGCSEFELTEIIRQEEGSTLLNNATKVRDLIFSDRRPELEFTWDSEMYRLEPGQVTDEFIHDFPSAEPGSGVIINFKNRDCLDYNLMIRKRYFPGKESIQPGDILMITKNSYNTFGHDLYNGDIAQVKDVSEDTEIQAADVYVDEGGKRVKKRFQFRFRDVVLTLPHIEPDVQVKIIDSMLNQPESGLSVYEMRALFINFNYRFNEEQNRRKNVGRPFFKAKSEEFKKMLKADPYYNALHVKYGYSVTCHKAQGGEWDKVYVNFSGRSGLTTDHLRWCYTAITRARRRLAAIHPPHVTSIGSITFAPVGTLKNIPAEALTFGDNPESPWHNSGKHPAKIEMYHFVKERLTGTPYHIVRIDSGDYLESYHIRCNNRTVRLDATHNAAGIFSPFQAKETDAQTSELCDLLNQPYEKSYRLNYTPGAPHFARLLGKMQQICSESDIQMISAIERPDNSYVTYYLSAGGNDFASIQFYFDGHHRFTRAIPKITNTGKKSMLDGVRDTFE